MTQDEIIRSPLGREQLVALAREAGCYEKYEVYYFVRKDLERFYQTAFEAGAAHEREACAKLFEGKVGQADLRDTAAAIRARGEK